MFRTLLLVTGGWSIIVGMWIFFRDGTKWCLACRETSMTLIGVISIVLGIICIVSTLRRSDSTPARG
jgi:hypothetical protein